MAHRLYGRKDMVQKMKKTVTLWVRLTDGERIIWTAGSKNDLHSPDSTQNQPYQDVELTGEIEVPNEEV